MTDEINTKLTSDNEWASLMDAAYEAQGSPVDEVSKERVWARLKAQKKPHRLVFGGHWLAVAAGIIAVTFVAKLLDRGEDGREKGGRFGIPAVLTAYLLEKDGTTLPIGTHPTPHTTVVFRVHSPQSGVYAILLAEGDESPRLAVDEGQPIGPEDQLVMKNSSIFGIRLEANKKIMACVVASIDKNSLALLLTKTSTPLAQMPSESCVSVEARSP